jgi:hypothetical protein
MRLGYPAEGFVFLNGDNVMRPWMELRTAYIHGCFQASLLIGQSFLENLLGGVADFSDKAGGSYLWKPYRPRSQKRRSDGRSKSSGLTQSSRMASLRSVMCSTSPSARRATAFLPMPILPERC